VEQGGTQTPPRSSKLETLVLLLRYPKFRNAGGGENHPRSYKKDFGKRFPDAIPVQMRGICKGTERARARAHERRDRRERASLTRGRERVPATFLHYGHWRTGHGAGGAPYVEWPWPWPLIDQLSIVYCFFLDGF